MKIQATGDNDSSPFDRLPDEIVFEILNKIIDLKTVCFCYVVCKRFCSIVVQVDTISFTTSPIDIDIDSDIGVPSPAAIGSCFTRDSFWSAIKSVKKFRALKSLSINLPFPTQQLGGVVVNNRYLFKWKINLSNNRLGPFVFLSPNSIFYGNNTNNGNEKEEVGEDVELTKKKTSIAFKGLEDATVRFIMLFNLIEAFPLLEKVSVSDSAKLGKVSVSGSKLDGIRNLKHCSENRCCWASHCYIPLLELPVSGYVMKGVTLVVVGWNDDSLVNVDFDGDIEDKEEAAYNEAVMKILKKHRGLINTACFMKSLSP